MSEQQNLIFFPVPPGQDEYRSIDIEWPLVRRTYAFAACKPLILL